jgi:hypothetical protein
MNGRRPWIVLVAALVLTLGLVACDVEVDIDVDDGETLQGSGNVVSEQVALADFTEIEAQSAFDLEITQSDTFAVTVRADDNILDLLDVSKSGDTLRLGLERGVSLRGDVTLEATITMPDLEGLKLSGASRASVSGFRSSGRLDINLSGASRVDGDLEAGEVDIRLSGASRVDGDLEAGDVDIDASGASRVVLEGSATGLILEGSGASSLDLADFTVNTAEVELNGASEATVNVQERIDPVDVSGASRLRYLGDPSLGDVSTSGGSSVDKVGD